MPALCIRISIWSNLYNSSKQRLTDSISDRSISNIDISRVGYRASNFCFNKSDFPLSLPKNIMLAFSPANICTIS